MDAEAWYAAAERFEHGADSTVFRRDGDRAGSSTLLCIHGFPTSSWDFASLWPELTRHFDCIAADLLGLGRASKPAEPLPVGRQADLLEALCGALGVDEVSLLAHDLGVTVAQELLARHRLGEGSLRVTRCVFLNGGLFPESHRPRPIQRLLASPLGPAVARLSTERTFRKGMRRVFGPETPPSEAFLSDSWKLLTSDGGRRSLPYLLRYIDERRRLRARWVEPLVERTVPARLVNGTLDPVSGAHVVDRYEALVPGADTVRLDHVGHYPHIEDPNATLAAVVPFFSDE
jgi:pimeloyl-ACP methyl ester carboxylesterase